MAVLISGSGCPNSIKNRNLRPVSVRAVRFENELNNYYKEQFQLWKPEVLFFQKKMLWSLSYPQQRELQQTFKKFSDDIRNYILMSLNELFPSKFDNDIKRVKILKDKH